MNSTRALKLAGLLGIAMTLATCAPARAAGDNEDPPSRVARLAYAHGAVSFQPAGTDDWVTSTVNRPMTTGDKLWSDSDSRAEMQLDGSLIRISNNTGIAFLNLSDNVTQIQFSEGTLLVRVRRLDDDETYEIDTPNLAFSILRPGLYRLSVNEAGDTTIIKVRTGEGEVTGGGAAFHVRRNEAESFTGSDQLAVNPLDDDGRGEDQFDTWSANRDAHWEHSRSSRYVSSDVVGYEDLDDHGEWRPTPEYGNVWFPRTERPDWAPYHYGHWAYVEPWGYTWVDDEPWGFAPFHYGRWICVDGTWGWVPAPPRAEGVAYVRPVYAPALVAWVGGGSGGGAGVAWFPLGPREVYVPSYPVSRNYVNNVNVSNTTVNTTVVNNYYNTTVVNQNVNVTNVKYVNQTVPGAVAATTSQAFTTAQPVAKNAVTIDQRAIASAPVRTIAPASVPTKQAVLGTGAATVAVAAKPPAAVETRTIVAKVAPPPPPPAFEKRQEAIRDNGGKPLSAAQVRQIQPAPAQSAATVRVVGPAKAAPAPTQNAEGGRAAANPAIANKPAPAQPNKPGQGEANKPAIVTTRQENRASDRPATLTNAVESSAKPATVNNAVQPVNRPSDRPGNPSNATPHADAHKPTPPPAHDLDQQRGQGRDANRDQDQLRSKQEQERPQGERQEPEHQQSAQQKADQPKKQQVDQHQPQTVPVQDKHPQEPPKPQDKKQPAGKNQPKPDKDDRPPKDKP